MNEVEPRFSGDAPWPFLDRDNRVRVKTFTPGGSRTKTEFLKQCDINVIMAQYKKTGHIAHLAAAGRYETLPDQSDYHEAMNIVAKSREAFAALPAELRDRFGNEPGRLLRFLEDPQNRREAEQLGLVAKKAPQEEPPTPPPSPNPAEPPKAP